MYHLGRVAAPERFSIVAPLDPIGGWRRALALDRGPGAPRAVVLSFVPDEISGDAARLGPILRDAEAAGRFHHPGAVSVLGTETVEGALAVVEAYRPGTSVRALLDAGGRLPADVAARVVIDVSAAVAKAHALDGGDGKALVHGSIDCARIAVAPDGSAMVSGFAVSGGGRPDADVRGLAAVLHEMVAGERPEPTTQKIDAPGIPAELSHALARALGAEPAGPFPSAVAFAEALAAAGPVASRDAVAAYVEAILPRAETHPPALRGALEAGPAADGDAEEVAAENLIVDPTDPAFRTPQRAFAKPLAPASPSRDAATTFRAPPPSRRRSRLPLAVATICAAVGFGGGFAAARLAPEFAAPAPATGPAPEPPAAAAVPAADAPPRPAPAPGAKPPKGGKSAKVTKPSRHGGRAAKAGHAEAVEEAAPPGTGTLDVTAPADADVFLDGRRIGKGNIRIQVNEGAHRIEVRLGPARVVERFSLAPGETWTYAVTPHAL